MMVWALTQWCVVGSKVLGGIYWEVRGARLLARYWVKLSVIKRDSRDQVQVFVFRCIEQLSVTHVEPGSCMGENNLWVGVASLGSANTKQVGRVSFW